MRFRVATSGEAGADLAEIRRWQTQPGSGPVARRRLTQIESALKDLRHYPLRWPLGEHPGIRELPVAGHRILYRIDEAGRVVNVLRVFSPYQDRARP